MCLAILAIVVLKIRSQRLPVLDSASFTAAQARWQEQTAKDYEIEIVVSGRSPGNYSVRVEQGIAKAATLDGRDLTRPRTFGTWSVDGMFETLQRDLDTNADRNNLMLGAEFHPVWGIPMRYERIEMQTGMHDALQWHVTHFGTQ